MKQHEASRLSVSQLNNQVKNLLEHHLNRVSVEGEISNLTCAVSGHWYFSLKDDKAQVSCAMFSSANRKVQTQPKNGDKVLVRASVSLYAPRGNYQLLIHSLQPTGFGQWQIAYAELHRKLAAEGLFADESKQALPHFPKRLGIITSTQGAVLQDILQTVSRRFPALPISIYPSSVQGEHAEGELIAALTLAEEDGRCDLLVIARGGGSIEDIWTFNLESVARAINRCPIPIISAIGHETDFTISDYVADIRASTPTAAAELATPDRRELLDMIARAGVQLVAAVEHQINNAQQGIDHARALLKHPSQTIEIHQHKLNQVSQRIQWSMQLQLKNRETQLNLLDKQLRHLDYRKPLQRGYVLAYDDQGQPITSAIEAKKAASFDLQFHDDRVKIRVT